MTRIAIPTRDEAPAAAQPILNSVHGLLGFVPNLHRLMSLSPNVLTGWANLQGALSKTLDVKTRDGIALAVSHVNDCDYCLSAHSYMSENFANLPPEEIALNRLGGSSDPRRAAAIAFARATIEHRGKVSDADLAAVRQEGFSDAEIVEIVGLTAQVSMTNFLNNVASTLIDFPQARPAQAA